MMELKSRHFRYNQLTVNEIRISSNHDQGHKNDLNPHKNLWNLTLGGIWGEDEMNLYPSHHALI